MVIGIAGLRTAGKDTTADYLVSKYGFEKRAFADKLKDGICALFDITREELEYMKYDYRVEMGGMRSGGFVQLFSLQENKNAPYVLTKRLSIREVLQRFGTEVCRDTYGKDFWLDMCLPKLDDYPLVNYATKNIVVSDMRFENERERVKEVGGYTWLIKRPGLEPDGHASEPEYDCSYFDLDIDNSGTVEELYEKIESAYNWCLDDNEKHRRY